MIKRQIGRIAGVLTLVGAAVLISAGTAQACPAWGIETGIGPTAAYDGGLAIPKYMFCDDRD